MNNYYTIEEKYLHAMDKYSYGKTPKSLQLLNEIIAAEPQFAKAYYQLGLIYYYELKDYQAAGYHFKICNELDPAFPDVYENYMELLAFLNMEKILNRVKESALNTPGVDHATIWNILGLFAEKNKNLQQAKICYNEAFEVVVDKYKLKEIEENLSRIQAKLQHKSAYRYCFAE